MNQIVLHIPHSSERLPRGFLKKTIIEKDKVLEFCHTIADNNTRALFGKNLYKKVVFNWSRIFCDVEKFLDNEKEVMAKFGMGAIYTKTNKGETFLSPSKDYVDWVIKKHYIPHHKKLDSVVKRATKKGRTILVDCHSFCRDIIMFDSKKENLPDICIGYNEGTPTPATKLAIDYFTSLGYNVKQNYPYSGSMLPDYMLQKQSENFESVMIEINKTIYLHDKTAYKALQMQINGFLRQLKALK